MQEKRRRGTKITANGQAFKTEDVSVMSTLKICVIVFAETTEARILGLGIHLYINLLVYGIKNRGLCLYFPLYLSMFVPFLGKLVSQFSQKLCEVEF